jgi:hypothetical protein
VLKIHIQVCYSRFVSGYAFRHIVSAAPLIAPSGAEILP